jgi:23S rRNA (guanosine2251-2'-O)-methyltransferase
VASLADRARSSGVPVEEVADLRSIALTESPQGVIAEARPLRFHRLEQLVERHSHAALLVLDHIEDPRNLGAAARSALAAGLHGLVIPERRSAPPGPAALKAAAGALELLPVARVGSVADGIDRLKRLGLWTVGLDAAGPRSLFGLDLLTEPVALVVGGEGRGLSRLVSQRCDVVVSIPLSPGVESLNASVAAALACFEVSRARHGSRPNDHYH